MVLRDLFYRTLVKPFYFRLDPEAAHEALKMKLGTLSGIPGFLPIMETMTSFRSDRLRTVIAGIPFPNPLGLAAGFDKSGELFSSLSRFGFGHIEVGTVTGEAQPGNPKPRVFRYLEDEALINRFGFNNPGAESVSKILGPSRNGCVRGINVGKTKVVSEDLAFQDYAKSIKILSPLADYMVINISSPNTPGLRSFQKKEKFSGLVRAILREIEGSFPVPTFIKFAPDMQFDELGYLLEESIQLGFSGIILTNTSIDKSLLKGRYTSVESEGGLSGVPIRSLSNERIRFAYQTIGKKIPIIGVGGVDSGESALEKILLGASLVQVYTGYVYKGPFLPYLILKYLDRFLQREGIKNIEEIVGKGA